MEMLQIVIVLESLGLAVPLGMTAVWFYSRSGRIMDLRVFGLLTIIWFYCMPGILGAFSPTILRFVIPLERPNVMMPVALSLPLMVISVLAGLLIRWGPSKQPSLKRQRQVAREASRRYHLGRLFLFSLLCLGLAICGAWKELHAVGGWFGVIHGGGKAYLEARVTKVLGIWGVALTLFPIAAIGLMYCAVRNRILPPGLRLPAAVTIFFGSTGVVALLTARHLIFMLLFTGIALLEIRSKAFFRLAVPVILLVIAVGAFGLGTFRYSSNVQARDEILGNFEHIQIAERIAANVQIGGYIWGGNIPDLVTFLVPRSIWPNKPMGNRISRTVFVEYAKIGGVKVPGMIGEAYASAGLVGVALEGFIYGVLLRRLAAFWDRRRGNHLQFASFGSVLLGFIYLSVHFGMFGPQDSTFVTGLLQIYVITHFCGYLRRDTFPRTVIAVPAQQDALAVT